MQVIKQTKDVWDKIVNADKGAQVVSISLTAEHGTFIEHLPKSFLKDAVRDMLTRELESQPGYLEAQERKLELELKAVEKQKAKLHEK
ncbi:hypothetical protein [Sulfuricurvum sp.]|uniref:hypothetical protein n=1 Tax=Sulfuricurvum sp. TaxID=2025608 RepID=UPI003569542C